MPMLSTMSLYNLTQHIDGFSLFLQGTCMLEKVMMQRTQQFSAFPVTKRTQLHVYEAHA